MAGWLAASSCVPATPSHLFEDDIAIQTTTFLIIATTLESGHDHSPGLGGRDPGETRHRSGQTAHDMTDRQGSLMKHDSRQVIFGQHSWRDGTSAVHCMTLAMIHGIAQVKIGIRVRRGQGRSCSQVVGIVGTGRMLASEGNVRMEGGRNGVGRRWQHGSMAGRTRGIASSSGQIGTRLGDVHGGGLSSKSHSDARGSSLRSHDDGLEVVVVVAKAGSLSESEQMATGTKGVRWRTERV